MPNIIMADPQAEKVYYNSFGLPYPANINDTTTTGTASAPIEYCDHLETIYRENATGVGQYAGGHDCKMLKSVHYPNISKMGVSYFIRQQAVATHTLERITLGRVGQPITEITNARWFYGDCKNGCSVTIYVDAETLADVPSAVSTNAKGDSHPSGYAINVIYRSSTTGEVLT